MKIETSKTKNNEEIKVENDKTKNEIIKVLCHQCKHETNHVVLSSVNIVETEYLLDDDYFKWQTDYEIIQCKGCDVISFRVKGYDPEPDENVNSYSLEIIFPKRTAETVNIISFHNVPSNINKLYQETINCYNNYIMTLCAAGIRALVEGICLDKKIEKGNLQTKINELVKKGIITEEQSSALHEQRCLGNEAVHELSVPSEEELSLAISLIKDILNSIYEVPIKTLKLRKARSKQ